MKQPKTKPGKTLQKAAPADLPEKLLLPLHLSTSAGNNLYTILGEVYDASSPEGWSTLLDEWFEAALADDYIYKKTPSAFLFSAEKLELLVYACYGLHQQSKDAGISACIKKYRQHAKITIGQKLRAGRMFYPRHLYLAEVQQPQQVLISFFKSYSFKSWQEILYHWKDAALANSSVIEVVAPGSVFPVMRHLYKLVEAGWLLWQGYILYENGNCL